MRDIKISVIVPVYNGGIFIESGLKDIISQSISDIEYIFVNDGSTDDSLEKLKRLRKNNPNIIVFSQNNAGAGAARNIGLKNASGQYVCFMDIDDYYFSSESLQMLYETAVNENADVCGGKILRDNNGILSPIENDGLYKKQGLINPKDCPWFFFTRMIYKRDFLIRNKITFPKLKVWEDPCFMVAVLAANPRIVMTKYNVYCYRNIHKKRNWTDDSIEELLKAFLIILNVDNDKMRNVIRDKIVSYLEYEYYFVIKKGILNYNIQSLLIDIQDKLSSMFSYSGKLTLIFLMRVDLGFLCIFLDFYKFILFKLQESRNYIYSYGFLQFLLWAKRRLCIRFMINK